MFENYKPELQGDTEVEVAPASTPDVKATKSKAEAHTSADSENTDEEPVKEKHVPYERFQEVNKKFRDTEAKLKDYESKSSKYKDYEALDTAMTKDPVLNKEINSIIEKYNRGELSKAEMKQEIKEAKAEAKDAVEPQSFKDTRFDDYLSKERQKTINAYKENFDTLIDNDVKEEKTKRLIENLVSMKLTEKYPSAVDDGYSAKRLNEVYKEVMEEMDGFVKIKTASYVKEKTSDTPPVTKTGSSVSSKEEFNSRSDESKYIAKGLKAIFAK